MVDSRTYAIRRMAELDETGLRGNLEAMVSRGVTFGHAMMLVAGAAGEFPILTRNQRAPGLRISADTVAGRVPVMTRSPVLKSQAPSPTSSTRSTPA